MSESVAEALETPTPLEFRGVSYSLAPRSLEMEGAVEVHLRRLAREQINADREVMTPVEYAEHLKGWRTEGPTEFAWDMPACQRFAQSPRGLRLLAYLQLREGTPGEKVTERLVHDWFADPAAGPGLMEAVLASNFPFLAGLLRQATQGSGSPPTGTSSAPDSPASPGGSDPGKSASSPDAGSPASSTGRATSTAV